MALYLKWMKPTTVSAVRGFSVISAPRLRRKNTRVPRCHGATEWASAAGEVLGDPEDYMSVSPS